MSSTRSLMTSFPTTGQYSTALKPAWAAKHFAVIYWSARVRYMVIQNTCGTSVFLLSATMWMQTKLCASIMTCTLGSGGGQHRYVFELVDGHSSDD